MINCTNCDQVNDLWDENRKLQKAYDEVCAERDKLKEENKSLYRACNILLAEQRGESEDESNN